MELIVQPDDGVTSLIKAIDSARKSVEIAIFRFDRADLQHALEKAVARGVSVRALIAHTNRGAENELRKLEMKFLEVGIEVARTAGDLLRYHYKFMIVDRRVLYLLTFNYTYLDIASTRSFGIITRNPDLVREALRLFEVDAKRQAYIPEVEAFLVSPLNARPELSRFIKGAEKELLIYDPEISDPQMIRLLQERANAGVKIRIVGHVAKPWSKICDNCIMRMRFHTRAIIRDRRRAFLGSQSLREAELDRRRELGVIVHNREVVRTLVRIFEGDWARLMPQKRKMPKNNLPARRTMQRLAKALVRDLPLEPLVERALSRALRKIGDGKLGSDKLEHRVEDEVRAALEDAVSRIVREGSQEQARL